MEQLAQQSPKAEKAHEDGTSDNLRQFLRLKPPSFHGSANPLASEDWLKEVEKIFEVMLCPDEEKVTLAIFMLQGGASDWWRVHKNKYTEDFVVTWKIFKEEFYRKYFPESVQRKMELEFLQLKQEIKSVAEYEIEFSRLARYAPICAQDDEAKARRFVQGLRQPIKAQVEVFEMKSFRDVANKALTVEQAYDEEVVEEEEMSEEDDKLRACSPQLPNTGN
ncbi:hypothetical protein ACQ4PT_025752 [Festuca glaucescens]